MLLMPLAASAVKCIMLCLGMVAIVSPPCVLLFLWGFIGTVLPWVMLFLKEVLTPVRGDAFKGPLSGLVVV
jgi:hypothetical protein